MTISERSQPSRLLLGVVFFSLISLSVSFAQDDTASAPAIQFIHGPAAVDVGPLAELQVPAGYSFANAEETKKLMELMQNPSNGNEVGFIGPDTAAWYIVFEYEEAGYVKDDEKDALDANAILESIQKGTLESNKERRKRGWDTLFVTGWARRPSYDQTTHNLNWAFLGGSQDSGQFVNYNTRLLGRRGVTYVTLVTDPSSLDAIIPQAEQLLTGFNYKAGSRYAEYKEGDKVAKYGLTALVVGGAGAVAAKAGIFKWLWKVIAAAVVGGAAWLKKLFTGKASEDKGVSIPKA